MTLDGTFTEDERGVLADFNPQELFGDDEFEGAFQEESDSGSEAPSLCYSTDNEQELDGFEDTPVVALAREAAARVRKPIKRLHESINDLGSMLKRAAVLAAN
eukprot:2520652-Rhodomonas_salina.1